MRSGDIFLWAHRGASAWAPENTMAAFAAAEVAGADGIELDIHLSRDGVPVVIHDATVDRTTDGEGQVRRLTFSALKRLDAGAWFSPSFVHEPVPALVEVLEWAGGRVRLNLEIKDELCGQVILDLLRQFPSVRALISSFDHRLLERIRRESSEVPLGFLVDSVFWRRGLKRAVACRAESFHPRQDLVSRAMISACHRHGLKVYPWTVDDPLRLEKLVRLGVNGVFTNDPQILPPE